MADRAVGAADMQEQAQSQEQAQVREKMQERERTCEREQELVQERECEQELRREQAQGRNRSQVCECAQAQEHEPVQEQAQAQACEHMRAQGSTQEQAPGKRTCECRHKATPRSEALQRDVHKRLNRVIGQLNGVKAMIDDNRYCGDVLIQLSAAESAVHRVSEMLLREHMQTCVVEEIRAGNDEVVGEVMDLIRRFS